MIFKQKFSKTYNPNLSRFLSFKESFEIPGATTDENLKEIKFSQNYEMIFKSISHGKDLAGILQEIH